MGTGFQTVLSMLGTLVLLVVIFYGAYWFSKTMGRRYQASQSSTPGGIELLVRQVLGKDEMLLIVRTGGRVFLLGVTPQHIALLQELDADDYRDVAPSAPADQNFLHLMKDLMKNKKSEKGADGYDNR